MARQNSKLLAILCHRSARDGESALGKHRHDILIAKGVPGIFAADDLGNRLAHAFVAYRLRHCRSCSPR